MGIPGPGTRAEIQFFPDAKEGVLRVFIPHGPGGIILTFDRQQAPDFLSKFAHATAIMQGMNPDDPFQPITFIR